MAVISGFSGYNQYGLDLDGHVDGSGSQFSGSLGVNLSGTVWGSTIPVSSGFRKITGVVLWAGAEQQINEFVTNQPGVFGFPPGYDNGGVTMTWDVTRTFAVSLGERLNPDDDPPIIRRIWVDGTLAYEEGAAVPLNWLGIDYGYQPAGSYVNGVYVTNPNADAAGGVVAGQDVPQLPALSNISFRFYDGNENQVADPALVAALGSSATAFRGLMYLVIEGLVFGQGFDNERDRIDQSLGINSGPAVSQQQQVNNNFPVVTVELVDGTSSSVSAHDFSMLAEATPLEFGGTLLSNFGTREIVTVGAHDGAVLAGEYWRFDMDTATQTAAVQIPVTEDSTTVGGPFAVWDTLNDVVYTERSGSHFICSIGSDGALINTVMDLGFFNLAPKAADGGTITDDNPATGFPRATVGDADYVVRSGFLQPIIACGNSWIALLAPSTAGVLEPSLIPQEFFQNDPVNSFSANSIMGLQLYNDALTTGHLSYQDACFVVASKLGVDLVYVSVETKVGRTVSKYLGRTRIHDPVKTGLSRQIIAIVASNGDIIVQESKSGELPVLISRITMAVDDSPNFADAPGWKGNFPHKVGYVYENVESNTMVAWNGTATVNSDTSKDTMSLVGTNLVNLADGSDSVLAGFGGLDSPNDIWDSSTGIRFFESGISDDDQQEFQGTGLKFAQVFSGINGDVGTVGDVVRQIAEAAGYGAGAITVGSTLTDEVPGVLILHPYSLAQLFNDIGALYGFAFSDSNGHLNFQSSTNDPVKAGGGWTIHSVPTNGNTATIGSFVYTWRVTPSAPFDVKIVGDDVVNGVSLGNAIEKNAANFLAALNADLTLAAPDSQSDAFGAGTLKNTQVTASPTQSSTNNLGFTSISFFAVVAGAAGNAISTVWAGGTQATFDHTTLTSGAEPPTPTVNLELSDLAPVNENQLTQYDGVVTTIAPIGLGQQAAAIDYFALEQNYQLSVQTYIPDDQGGTILATAATTVTYDLPFVMSTSEAYQRVVRTALQAGENVITQDFRLPQQYLLLEPSDLVSLHIPPFTYQVRLDEATFNGDWSTSFSAVNFSVRADVAVENSDSQSSLPQSVPSSNTCLPVIMDAPVLNPGFRTTAGSLDLQDGVRALAVGFSSGVLSVASEADGATTGPSVTVLQTSKDVRWATVVGSVLAAVEPYYRTVEDSITLSLKTIAPSDLAAAGYQDFVAGKNCLAVGQPGNWEYIFFRDFKFLNTKTVQLTGLLRAQRGTDAAVAHAAGDYALLLSSVAPTFVTGALKAQSLPSTSAGLSFRYFAKGFPAAASQQLDVTVRGLQLYPFAPCHLAAAKVTGNVLDLSWTRRDRLGVEFVTNDQDMSETTEEYELEILDGSGTVVRTVTALTSPAYAYASADQTTDGFTPGSVATLQFRVYQVGELGRGFPRMETVNVN